MTTALLTVILTAIPAIAQEEAGTTKNDIESAAAYAIESCQQDLERLCANVTPGEGRMLSCLLTYDDQVTPAGHRPRLRSA